MMNNYKYMEMACDLAFEKTGMTSPNPAVGAVIVKDGLILGSGGTGPCGSDHAEVRAINDALNGNNDITGSEMFVTLEPCNHYGRTPPCTEAIISAGISRVHVAIEDPNPLVAGKGMNRLREAGIEVIIADDFSRYAFDLIRGFKKQILEKKPFVLSKSAVTLDGKIATDQGDSKWISDIYSRYITHRLRAKCDAIIVGKGTYIADNPSLNVRLFDFSDDIENYFENNDFVFSGYDNFFLRSLIKRPLSEYKDPLRVLAGIPDFVHESSPFFRDDNYIIIAGRKEYEEFIKDNSEKKNSIKGLNLELTDAGNNLENVNSIMDILLQRGVNTALLEGGSGLNSSFFNAGCIDQFMYFIAPRVSGNGIAPLSAAGSASMSDALDLYNVSTVMLKNDLLYNGYREEYKKDSER